MTASPAPCPKHQLDIAYFMELQRRVFEIFRYVSCHEDNFDVYSIVLESVLVDSGSFFDSLCQTFIRSQSSSGQHFKRESEVSGFEKKANGTDDFNFADYRTILQGEFGLSERKVNLNPYVGAFYGNPTNYAPDNVSGYLIEPFREWSGDDKASPWWKAFTALKHDRLINFQQATLRNVVHAVAAVFIVLTMQNESDFKDGRVGFGIYDLFLPKYWEWKGKIMPGNFTWK